MASLILTVLCLVVGPSAAAAQSVGHCYPPPCAVQPAASAPAGPAGATPTASGLGDAAGGRSPVAVVAPGLLAVIGSLTAVGLRRRSHIVRRAATPVHATAPASGAAGAPSSPEPQPALG